jgi:hypothetical protein
VTTPRNEIDAVAEAMCTADDYIWGLLIPDEADHYRRMAGAAVDVLQLKEEWGIRCGDNIVRSGTSAENAKSKAAQWPESFEATSRLVGPWVEEQP